ncbi:MAG: 3-hydroxybutyrate dehydrogenase [Pirellulales bacterium]
MLRGKAAVVTGSTSGIGLGIASALAAQGADLLINGFGEATAIETLRQHLAREHGVKVAYSGADVSKPAQVHAMIEMATRELGHVDILVNNAGIQHIAATQEFPVDQWDAIIAINLSAVFHATRAALPQMLARNWGRIINIASVHGLVGSVDKVAYVASKHGVVGMTKVVGLETAHTGVTCNAICPGFVLTPLIQQQLDDVAARERVGPDEAKKRLLGAKQPSLDFVTTDELGALAVFLCSEAAGQIRGAALPVDGAWLAQ